MAKHVDEPVEEYESIPWDVLLEEGGSRRRRWILVAAGAVVALAVSASAARTLWPRPATPVAAPTTQPVASVPPTVPPATTTLPPLSEADLLAVAPAALEREAAALAVLYAADYFTRDGGEEAGLSFVESVVPLHVEDLGGGRFAVTLGVRSLSGAGEGYVRVPPRALEVVVDLGGDRPEVVDIPRPVERPQVVSGQPVVEVAEPPPAVVDSALGAAVAWGTPDPSTVAAGRVGDLWRVELSVTDGGGVTWRTAVWTDQEGTEVPAGG